MRRLKAVSLLLILGLLFTLSAATVSAKESPADPAKPKTWQVLVGGQTELQKVETGLAGAWQFMKFYPAQITINVGDTIVFKYHAAEIHNVYFPGANMQFPDLVINGGIFNPAVLNPVGGPTYDGSQPAGSGIFGFDPNGPTQFKLTFTKEGTFTYVCSVHSAVDNTGNIMGMMGKVTVNKAGTPYPKTQEQVEDQVEHLLAKDARIARMNDPAAREIKKQAGPNGTTIYHLNVGFVAKQDPMIEFMRFGSQNLKIHKGDTVVWTPQSGPHTVTFLNGNPEPALFTPTVFNGKNTFAFNPAALLPVGGATFDKTKINSSGEFDLFGNNPYSLTFNDTGKFNYICIFHDNIGMTGSITVRNKAPGENDDD
jgi:plastocyanin